MSVCVCCSGLKTSKELAKKKKKSGENLYIFQKTEY